MLFGGSPLLICSKDSENCLVIIPEEKQYVWCDYEKETCDAPNLSAISKIREVKQAITLQNEKRACQSKSGGWFWLGSQCSFSNEIECERRGQEYYWSGSECLVNPYWDCQVNHTDTSDWNGTACVFSQKKADQSACKKQQDHFWNGTTCEFSQAKQDQRLKQECLEDRSKVWTGSQCVDANSLAAGVTP
jgi:hypothetical protein